MEQKYLTKKQINSIQKRIENEVFKRGRRYSEQEVKEIFDGTNYPPEIINKEISRELKNDEYYTNGKLSERYQKNHDKFWDNLKTVAKWVIYPTIGANLFMPTIISKIKNDEEKEIALLSSIFGPFVSFFVYTTLSHLVPEAIPYVLGTQLTTNTISGVYESIKSVKKEKYQKKSLEGISESQ